MAETASPAAARPDPTPTPMPALTAVLALALLLGLQPVTTDVYLPSLPALRADLGAAMSSVQLTLSALMFSFGLGQLVLGPVADRVGRRPLLLWGLGLYTLAAVGAALSPVIDGVVLARALQGFGLAAAVVCARAMVRDLYEPQQGAQIMAKALGGLGLIAMLSPSLGGLIAAAWGWRAAMGAVAVFSAVSLAFIALRVPETLRQRNPQATRLGPLMSAWRAISLHPTFIAYAALTSFSYGALYTFLAGSSFIFIGLYGVSRPVYGMLVGGCSGIYVLGTLWCRRMLQTRGLPEAIRRGAVFTLSAALAMVGLTLSGLATVPLLVAAQCLFHFGHGVLQPCAQAGVVGPFPRHAGAASALSGFVIAALAFGVGGWLSVALNGTLAPWTFTIAGFALLSVLTAWTLVQRIGQAGLSAVPIQASGKGA